MPRCHPEHLLLALALSAPLAAEAQVARNFPQNALRGQLEMGEPPSARLNGDPARLAPGVRIRGIDNMLLMSATMSGQRYTVNYTLDPLGLVKDVWVLRPEEIERRWPKTAEDAARWSFDPIAQTWTKP